MDFEGVHPAFGFEMDERDVLRRKLRGGERRRFGSPVGLDRRRGVAQGMRGQSVCGQRIRGQKIRGQGMRGQGMRRMDLPRPRRQSRQHIVFDDAAVGPAAVDLRQVEPGLVREAFRPR